MIWAARLITASLNQLNSIKMEQILKNNWVVEGNEFVACIPQAEWSSATGEIVSIDASLLDDLVAYVGIDKKSRAEYEASTWSDQVRVSLPSSLRQGVYNIWLRARLGDRDVAAAIKDAFVVVPFGERSFIKDGMLNVKPALYLSGTAYTDEDIAALKQELREEIQLTQEARAEYEAKVQMLDGVAKQGTNPNATNTAILAAIGGGGGGEIPEEQFDALAKEETLNAAASAMGEILQTINGGISDIKAMLTLEDGEVTTELESLTLNEEETV